MMQTGALQAAMNANDFHFQRILRELRRHKLRAKFDGDEALKRAYIEQETLILDRLRSMREAVDEALLDTDRVAGIAAALRSGADRARDLLDRLKAAERALDQVKAAAELALSILRTVTGLIG